MHHAPISTQLLLEAEFRQTSFIQIAVDRAIMLAGDARLCSLHSYCYRRLLLSRRQTQISLSKYFSNRRATTTEARAGNHRESTRKRRATYPSQCKKHIYSAFPMACCRVHDCSSPSIAIRAMPLVSCETMFWPRR